MTGTVLDTGLLGVHGMCRKAKGDTSAKRGRDKDGEQQQTSFPFPGQAVAKMFIAHHNPSLTTDDWQMRERNTSLSLDC
jgi:hypothetical protein